MRSLPIFVMATGLLFACKKEKQRNTNPRETGNPVVEEDSSNYSRKSEYLTMKVGNYWVYDIYELDSLGNERLLDYKDSTAITKDTIISGKRYFWYENLSDKSTSIHSFIGFYRDSLKNKVDRNGNILFSENTLNQIINIDVIPENHPDTLMYVEYKMVLPNELISVPAGDFEALNYRGNVYRPNQCEDHPKSPRYFNAYYVKNVGLIKQSYFYSSSCNTYFERRLVRYYVEE